MSINIPQAYLDSQRPADAGRSISFMGDVPLLICLTGSGQHAYAFDQAIWKFGVRGHIVLCAGFERVKAVDTKLFDEAQIHRIRLADILLVLNVGGYIGRSTDRDIQTARQLLKPIWFLEPQQ